MHRVSWHGASNKHRNNKIRTMKNSAHSISLILAAGLAGVALFKLADVSLVAALPGGAILAFALSAAAIGLAISDYSRRVQPLMVPGRVVRPALRAAAASCANNADRGSSLNRDRAA